MGAPQIIWLALLLIYLLCVAILHGEKRRGFYNFPVTFVEKLLTFALLYWGGFFGG